MTQYAIPGYPISHDGTPSSIYQRADPPDLAQVSNYTLVGGRCLHVTNRSRPYVHSVYTLMCGVSSRALRKLIVSRSYEQSTIITRGWDPRGGSIPEPLNFTTSETPSTNNAFLQNATFCYRLNSALFFLLYFMTGHPICDRIDTRNEPRSV